MEQEKKKKEVQKQNQQVQQDNTPKWKKAVAILFAIGSCSTIIASFFGLFGDSLGQCIKNRSYTKNYQKRLDMDYEDMVRRDQYYRNRKNND